MYQAYQSVVVARSGQTYLQLRRHRLPMVWYWCWQTSLCLEMSSSHWCVCPLVGSPTTVQINRSHRQSLPSHKWISHSGTLLHWCVCQLPGSPTTVQINRSHRQLVGSPTTVQINRSHRQLAGSPTAVQINRSHRQLAGSPTAVQINRSHSQLVGSPTAVQINRSHRQLAGSPTAVQINRSHRQSPPSHKWVSHTGALLHRCELLWWHATSKYSQSLAGITL